MLRDFPAKPHCWSGPVSQTDRVREIARFVVRKKPEDATTPWWKYSPRVYKSANRGRVTIERLGEE
jgi:hypothetical protein